MQPDKLNNNPSHLNTSIKRNQLVFSIAMIALQILASVLYGNFVQIPQSLINIGSILTTIFIFFLVVIGTNQIIKDLDYFSVYSKTSYGTVWVFPY